MSTTFNENVIVNSSSNGGDQVEVNSTGTRGGGLLVKNQSTTVGTLASSGAIKGTSASDLMIAASSGKKLLLASNGATTEEITLESGNVGIGTTSPAARLDVNGTVRATSQTVPSGGVGVEMTYSGGVGGVHAYDRTAGTYQALGINGSTLTLQASSAGPLGIRTNTEAGFDVAISGFTRIARGATAYDPGDPSNLTLQLRASALSDGGAYGVWFVDGAAASSGAYIAAIRDGDNQAPLVFGTKSTTYAERMRIAHDGKVGIGTTSPSSKLHVNGGVQVGSPTGGDQGTGTINVSGDIYKNGTAYTNPDYVFEQYFGGSNEHGYSGPVPLDQLEQRLRTSRHLPGISRDSMGLFARHDVLLEKLEEAYLYIAELTGRIRHLETRMERAGQ